MKILILLSILSISSVYANDELPTEPDYEQLEDGLVIDLSEQAEINRLEDVAQYERMVAE